PPSASLFPYTTLFRSCAKPENPSAQRMNLRQGEIEPDGEQQENNAEFSQRADSRDIHHRPDGIRSHDQPDQQISKTGRDMHLLRSEEHTSELQSRENI